MQTAAPNGAGHTSGMLGYMFWAAECQGTRRFARHRPIAARAEWASARRLTAFRSRCRRFDSTDPICDGESLSNVPNAHRLRPGEFVGSQCQGRCRSDPAVSIM